MGIIVCRIFFVKLHNYHNSRKEVFKIKTNNEIDTLKQIGMNIRVERIKKNYSQEKLAHKSNLDRTYIGGIERGETNPTILNLIKISHALEISLLEILENI